MSSTLISLENSYSLVINNTLFEGNNQLPIGRMGGLLSVRNVLSKTFTNLTFFENYGDQNAFLVISDDLQPSEDLIVEILFIDCVFKNNTFIMSLSSLVNSEVGGVLFVGSSQNLLIKTSVFFGNRVFSDKKCQILPSSPCFISTSTQNRIWLEDSDFIDNHSEFGSNCVTFSGFELTIRRVKMINNTDVHWEPLLITLKPGGSLSHFGQNLDVNDSYFGLNNGQTGGAILIQPRRNANQSIYIRSSVFVDNVAGHGGAIAFDGTFLELNAYIEGNYFLRNLGSLGGSIRSKIDTPTPTQIYLASNVFEAGMGCFGAFLLFEFFFSVRSSGNVFIEGTAFECSDGSGIGSVGGLSSTSFSSYTGSENKMAYGNSLDRAVWGIFGGNYSENGSHFLNNWGFFSGTIHTNQNSLGWIENCSFMNESGSVFGSVVIADHSVYSFIDVIFKNCSAFQDGGSITVSENSQISFNNSLMIGCHAIAGSLFYFQENYNGKSIISASLFMENYGNTNLIDISNTELIFLDSQFFNNSINLFFLDKSQMDLLNCTINGLSCLSGFGCLLRAEKASKIIIEDSSMLGITNKRDEGTIFLEDSGISISRGKMIGIFTSKMQGDCLSLYNSSFFVEDSQFVGYSANCVWAYLSNMSAITSEFKDSVPAQNSKTGGFGSIYCHYCWNVRIWECNFSNNSIEGSGSAIYLLGELLEGTALIQKSLFKGNTAKDSGTIYIDGQKTSILDSKFEGNQARKGAGIFSSNLEAEVTLTGNEFVNNEATLEGGAVKWSLYPPIFSQNRFLNNSARYGDNIAGLPSLLLLEVFSPDNFSLVLSTNSSQNTLDSKVLGNVSSGKDFLYIISFKLLDIYGNIVNTEQSLITLSAMDLMESLFIQGENPINLAQGSKEVRNLQFYHAQNSEVEVKAASSIRLFNDPRNSSFLVFKIRLNQCQIGEIYLNNSFTCQECPLGKFSLGDPLITYSCSSCPLNTVTCYRNVLVLKPGFWRRNNASLNIYDCEEYGPQCKGGSDFSNQCEYSYTGPLCRQCIPHYSKLDNSCSECRSTTEDFVFVCLSFLCYIAFITIVISLNVLQSLGTLNSKSIFEGGFSLKNEHPPEKLKKERQKVSVNVRILMDYVQMLSMAQNMRISWPVYFKGFLGFFGISDITGRLLNLDCILLDMNVKIEGVFIKSAFITMIPFSFCGVAVMYFLISGRKLRSIKIMVMIFVLFTFVQPSVISKLLEVLSCTIIDAKPYLDSNLDYECYSSEHMIWIYSLAIPFLSFWCVLYPGACLISLLANSQNLHNPRISAKFSFFLSGYHSKVYYWEFLIIYKKVIILLICFLHKSAELQATLLLFVTGFYYYFTKKKRPFRLPRQNLMENWSNFSAFMIIFAANLYLNLLGEDKKSMAVLLAFIASNCFLLFWLLDTFDIVFENHAKLFKRRLFRFYVIYRSLRVSWVRTKYDGDLASFARVYWQNFKKVRLAVCSNQGEEKKSGDHHQFGKEQRKGTKYFKDILGFFGDL